MYKTTSKNLQRACRSYSQGPSSSPLNSRERRLVEHYVGRLGLASIALTELRQQRRIRLDLHYGFKEPRAGKALMSYRTWCKDALAAESIIDKFGSENWRAAAGGGWFDLTCGEAVGAITRIAAALNIGLTLHASLLHRAAVFVRGVDDLFFEMQERGEMKAVNAAYKVYRQTQTANQQRVESYEEWRMDYLARVISAVAERTLMCG